jgi:cyclopropane fatty-acyl-phospholipid synthase-like methyltransferase
MAIEASSCPLCKHACLNLELPKPGFRDRAPLSQKQLVRYRCCLSCGFIRLNPEFYLSDQEEKAHYDMHNNDPADQRYQAFLNRLWDPLKQQLTPGATGLDYGSGPGPALHTMARNDGFPCKHYDPFYHPDKSVLQTRYDFVTCSETAEHFHDPLSEFHKIANLLKPGGWLGLMTTRLQPHTDFANWHYRHDPTHVSFYTDESIQHLAKTTGFDNCQFVSNSVALLRKPDTHFYR